MIFSIKWLQNKNCSSLLVVMFIVFIKLCVSCIRLDNFGYNTIRTWWMLFLINFKLFVFIMGIFNSNLISFKDCVEKSSCAFRLTEFLNFCLSKTWHLHFYIMSKVDDNFKKDFQRCIKYLETQLKFSQSAENDTRGCDIFLKT